MHDDRRIREAQKHVDPVDPDPEHCQGRNDRVGKFIKYTRDVMTRLAKKVIKYTRDVMARLAKS